MSTEPLGPPRPTRRRRAALHVGAALLAATVALIPPPARPASAAADPLANSFTFVRAYGASAVVRSELAQRGYRIDLVVIVGRTARPDGHEPRARFRVWREAAVPGGWTGAPLP